MKRLILFITLIALSILALSLGFFSPYNCFTAKRELKTNHFKKICINEKHVWFVVEKKMGDKYGIEVINISDPYEKKPVYSLGIRIYNKTMMRGFIRSKGEKVYKEYNSELDSLCRQIIYL